MYNRVFLLVYEGIYLIGWVVVIWSVLVGKVRGQNGLIRNEFDGYLKVICC